MLLARGSYDDLHVLPKRCEEVHKAFDGKGASAVAHQRRDVRLLDAENFFGFHLLDRIALVPKSGSGARIRPLFCLIPFPTVITLACISYLQDNRGSLNHLIVAFLASSAGAVPKRNRRHLDIAITSMLPRFYDFSWDNCFFTSAAWL